MCATKAWSNSSACKNFRDQRPLGAEIWSPEKVDLGGSKLTCQTFWIVDQSSPDFFCRTRQESNSINWLSGFEYLESLRRFAIKVGSCVKSRKILHVFWPTKFFRGGLPEILDLHYKTGADTDHRAKFRGDPPTELGDIMAKKNITTKTEGFPELKFRAA